jgi:hypothetical protein
MESGSPKVNHRSEDRIAFFCEHSCYEQAKGTLKQHYQPTAA